MSEGKYEFALQRLDAAETYNEFAPEKKAEVLYLKGICHESLNQEAKAQELFRLAAEEYPETLFGRQSNQKLKAP